MSMVPAFSSLAAPEDDMMNFVGMFPSVGDILPAGGDWNSGQMYPGGWNFGLASPSDMPGGFFPGGSGGMWGAPQDPFDGLEDPAGEPPAEIVDPEIMPPVDPWEDLFAAVETYDDVDVSEETEDDSSADESETEEDDADTGYYAKLLVYDIPDKAEENELLAGYIDEIFYGRPDDTPFTDYWRSVLSGDEREFYDDVKDFIEEIAASDEYYPVFDASGSAPVVRLTKARLGLPDNVSNTDWYEASLNYYLENVINVNRVMNYIYRDDPCDFYWTRASYVVSFAAYIEDGYCVISMPALYFPVENGYEGYYVTEADGYDIFSISNEEMLRAVYVAETARSIAEDHDGETDAELLASFMDEISELTLDKDYIEEPDSEELNDPWQIVRLFDKEDPDGLTSQAYAKAFQYLCDMSGFEGCYTVTGRRAGRAHTWNVVELDGEFYVVDLAGGRSAELIPVGSRTAEYVYEGI